MKERKLDSLVSFEKQGHNGVFLGWVLSVLKTLGTLHGPHNLLLKGQRTLRLSNPRVQQQSLVFPWGKEESIIHEGNVNPAHPTPSMSSPKQTSLESCMNTLFKPTRRHNRRDTERSSQMLTSSRLCTWSKS